jgi:CHAD domain-containing protein
VTAGASSLAAIVAECLRCGGYEAVPERERSGEFRSPDSHRVARRVSEVTPEQALACDPGDVSDLRETLEREVKLSTGDVFEMPDLGGETLESRVFVSTYHDTPDHLLAQSGLTLRHRVENGRGRWQLKLPAADGRLEIEEDGPAHSTPPGILALLAAFLRRSELVPVARLRTRRDGIRVDGAEVVHDSVAVLDGQRVARTFDELEVELIEGDERALKRLEKALRRAGATDGETRPKVFQALDLVYEPDPDEPPRDETPAAVLAAAFRSQYARLLRYDPGTRLGTDSEDLHQLRVATRRLRAFLRAGRPLLARDWADDLRGELGWLGGALGPVRDQDVLIEHLAGEAAALGEPDVQAASGLLDELRRQRAAARGELLQALSDERYSRLLDRVEAAGDPPLAGVGDVTLDAIWRREHARLRKAVDALEDEPADEALHAVRIKVKRARYAAELAGLRGYVRAAKALQDTLGDHQDSVVAEERLRDLAARHPEAATAAGRLVERQRLRHRAARAEWRSGWRALAKQAKTSR